jgi:hypothetical protein
MSDTTRRISGTSSATVGPLSVPVAANPGYRVSNVIRADVVGEDGVHGFSEKPQAGMIKFQARDMAGCSVSDFEGITSETVELTLNNGKVVTGTDMWCVSALDVNSSDATFDLEFHGDNVAITQG